MDFSSGSFVALFQIIVDRCGEEVARGDAQGQGTACEMEGEKEDRDMALGSGTPEISQWFSVLEARLCDFARPRTGNEALRDRGSRAWRALRGSRRPACAPGLCALLVLRSPRSR